MKLRYTGNNPLIFLTGNVGEVQPGGEFTVPEKLAARFLNRPDIEAVEKPARTPRSDSAKAE